MNNDRDIQKEVLERIRQGKVSMRPRIYFVGRVLLIVLLSLITLVLSVFVLSFTLFSVHESGEQFLLGFGQRGLQIFIALFPWWQLALVILLLLTLEILLRHFRFAYRTPILGIFLGILGLTIVASIGITFTPLHMNLLDEADHQQLPLIGELYETIRESHRDQGVLRGNIISISGNQFVITHEDNDKDADDGTWTVIAPTNFDMATLSVGEKVYVVGQYVSVKGVFDSIGVRAFQ